MPWNWVPSIVLGDFREKRHGRFEFYLQGVLVGSGGAKVDEFPKVFQFVFSELSSIVFLIIGFLSDGLGFLLSPISLILANKSLKITNASPSHRDRRIARAAQIISWVMFGPVLLGIALISIFVLIG